MDEELDFGGNWEDPVVHAQMMVEIREDLFRLDQMPSWQKRGRCWIKADKRKPRDPGPKPYYDSRKGLQAKRIGFRHKSDFVPRKVS